MKRGPGNDGWPSVVHLHVIKKSEPRFCIFPKVKSVDDNPESVPVYLNVYDLTPANGYLYWAGLGVFHAGVEVYGVEYSFGAHDCPTSGVFDVEPRQCPGFKFRKSIFMGTTNSNPFKIREFMEQQSANYHGNTYNLMVKNCNHFCADICQRLTGNSIPKWVNRLARLGSVCNCLLPDALRTSTPQEDPNIQGRDGKKKLRAAFSCFSSMSRPQKLQRKESKSPLIQRSQNKGFLRAWRTRKGSRKEG
ncbi:deSI-like protein At4g17486 [Prosopis cineraria]|uniref:deSI-like protein At4g17486 n=1 Tax=Prosopis cineraria TaxID=364024 RepID=UPI00240F0B20|nr:deSI-like protein At4g17486 [Prosopis cineraria]